MHIVIADIICLPGAEGEMSSMTGLLAEASRGDEGCISYAFFADVENPEHFISVEQWETAEAAKAHMSQPHVAQALAALPDLIAAPPVITVHEVASSRPMG